MIAAAGTRSSSSPTEELRLVAQRAKSGARFFALSGILLIAFGAFLHFHFNAEMNAVERGSPNLAGAFIIARQAELAATGTAFVLGGFAICVASGALSWVARLASLQLGRARSEAALTGSSSEQS